MKRMLIAAALATIAAVASTAATVAPAFAACRNGSPCARKCAAQHEVSYEACRAYWSRINARGRNFARSVEQQYYWGKSGH